MKGLYINLDTCVDRRRQLEQALNAAGLDASTYARLAAVTASGDEPEFSRGLNSPGELGLWKSMISALRWIATGPFEAVVHVVEDDATFSASIPSAIQLATGLMLTNPAFQRVDLIFLDYFLDQQLCAAVSAPMPETEQSSVRFLKASKAYLGTTGSFLVRRSSAGYLSKVLARILATAEPLLAVDIVLRSLLQLGAIEGLLMAPPMGAPAWELNTTSTIQAETFATVRCSQRAHLLLRLLASGLQSADWCTDRLAELHGVEPPIPKPNNTDAFLHFFETLQAQMVSF